MWSKHRRVLAGVEIPGLASIETLLNDSEDLLRATAKEGNERIQEVRAKVEKSLRRAQDTLEVTQRRALRQAKRLARGTDAYAHDHPWKLAFTGVGIGVLIGLLVRGR